jgi:TetR/AcrR family transcriptional regulator, regulator of biofilm formation and stress response
MQREHNDITGSRKGVSVDKQERLDYGDGRQAVLEATVAVVAQKGLEGLTLRAVAAEAGVTHGLVHYHFGSRDALIKETLEWVIRDALVEMQLVPHDGSLDEFAEGMADLSPSREQAHLFSNELLLAACRDADYSVGAKFIYKEISDAVRLALEAAGIETTPSLTLVLVATIHGLTLHRLLFRSPQQTRQAAAELRKILALLAK